MSRKHTVRVGVLTLALSLIGLGVVWLGQNLTGVAYFSYLTRWWPVLLILLGLEYLWLHNRYEPETTVRWSFISVVLIFLIASGLATAAWIPTTPLQQMRDMIIEEAQNEERYSFQLDPISDFSGKTVLIQNKSGQIQVKNSNDGKIHINGNMNYIRQDLGTDDGIPGQVRVVPGDPLIITAENNERFKLRSVSYEVWLPPGLNLEVKNGSGRVQVAGVNGSLAIDNQTGEVNVSDIQGKVAVRNGSGNIRLQNVVGDTELRSSLGMIEVNDFQGALLAEANTGSINVKTVKPVTDDWDLRSSQGSIETRISARSNVVLEASTQSGSVNGSDKLNWQDQNGKKVSRLGDGQGTIKMTVQRGSINVRLDD